MKQIIVWGEISDKPKFFFEEDGELYCEATTFLLTGENLLTIICFLNSKLAYYLFSKSGTTTGFETVRWKKYKVFDLFTPILNKSKIKELRRLYNDVRNGQSTPDVVDRFFYEVIGITAEEQSDIDQECAKIGL